MIGWIRVNKDERDAKEENAESLCKGRREDCCSFEHLLVHKSDGG